MDTHRTGFCVSLEKVGAGKSFKKYVCSLFPTFIRGRAMGYTFSLGCWMEYWIAMIFSRGLETMTEHTATILLCNAFFVTVNFDMLLLTVRVLSFEIRKSKVFYGINIYNTVEVNLPIFLTSALDGGEWSVATLPWGKESVIITE